MKQTNGGMPEPFLLPDTLESPPESKQEAVTVCTSHGCRQQSWVSLYDMPSDCLRMWGAWMIAAPEIH